MLRNVCRTHILCVCPVRSIAGSTKAQLSHLTASLTVFVGLGAREPRVCEFRNNQLGNTCDWPMWQGQFSDKLPKVLQ